MASSATAANEYRGTDPCSLANAVRIVGERWTFFVLREALAGATRFSEFRSRLGVAPDVLSARLSMLVEAKLMERRQYRVSGQRTRDSYHLTDAGRQLGLTVVALQQWGDEHTPSTTPSSVASRSRDGAVVKAAFVDADGNAVAAEQVLFVRAEPEPASAALEQTD